MDAPLLLDADNHSIRKITTLEKTVGWEAVALIASALERKNGRGVGCIEEAIDTYLRSFWVYRPSASVTTDQGLTAGLSALGLFLGALLDMLAGPLLLLGEGVAADRARAEVLERRPPKAPRLLRLLRRAGVPRWEEAPRPRLDPRELMLPGVRSISRSCESLSGSALM